MLVLMEIEKRSRRKISGQGQSYKENARLHAFDKELYGGTSIKIDGFFRLFVIDTSYAIFHYHKSGYERIRLLDYNGSIEDYSKVIKLNPEDFWLYIYRNQS